MYIINNENNFNMEVIESVFIDSANKELCHYPNFLTLTQCFSNTELLGTTIATNLLLKPIDFQVTMNIKECEIKECSKNNQNYSLNKFMVFLPYIFLVLSYYQM